MKDWSKFTRTQPSRLHILLLLGAATLSGGCIFIGPLPNVSTASPSTASTASPAPAATTPGMTDKSGDNGKGSNASYY